LIIWPLSYSALVKIS